MSLNPQAWLPHRQRLVVSFSELDESPLCVQAIPDTAMNGAVCSMRNVEHRARCSATGLRHVVVTRGLLLARYLLYTKTILKAVSGVTVPGFWSGKHRRRLVHDGVRSTVKRRSPLAPAPFQGVLGSGIAVTFLEPFCLEQNYVFFFGGNIFS